MAYSVCFLIDVIRYCCLQIQPKLQISPKRRLGLAVGGEAVQEEVEGGVRAEAVAAPPMGGGEEERRLREVRLMNRIMSPA
jgi:hypothetical protein